MTLHHPTIPGRLVALLIATALLAGGLLATRADAAPPGAITRPTAPVATVIAPPTADDFSVIALSRTSARLVGRGPYAGITVDVQGLSGGTASMGITDILGWLKDKVSGSGGTKTTTCTATFSGTINVTGNNNTVTVTVTVPCNPA
jgi:hypothetical protein